MKIRNLFAAALLPLTLACAKENLNKTEDNASISLSVNVSSEDTKASFSDTEGLIWVKDNVGQAGLVKNNGQDNSVASTSSSITDQYNITFNFSGINPGSYRLFYPYVANTYYGAIQFSVPQMQRSSAGQSSDIFAGISQELIPVKTDAKTDPTCENVKYNAVGSYIRFRVYGKEGLAVNAINIESQDSKVAGLYYIKGDEKTLDETKTDGKSSTSFVLSDGYKTVPSKENSQSIYAAVLPGNSQNTYTVVTNEGFYKFSSKSSKEFANGSIKEIPLNIGGKTPTWVPDHLYLVGGSANAWDCNNPVEMQRIEGTNKFQAEVYLIPTSDYKTNGYKFLTRKGFWEGAFVNDGSYKMKYYEDPRDLDKKFTVGEPGRYKVTVDFDSMTVKNERIVAPIYIVYKNDSSKRFLMPETAEIGVYKASVYIPASENYNGAHDFYVVQGNSYFHNGGWIRLNFNKTGDGVLEGQCVTSLTLKDITSTVPSEGEVPKGWYVDDPYDGRTYEFVFDTNRNTMQISYPFNGPFYLIDADGNKLVEEGKSPGEDGWAYWEYTTTGPYQAIGFASSENSKVYSQSQDSWYNLSSDWGIKDDKEFGATFRDNAQPWCLVSPAAYKIYFNPSECIMKVRYKE